MTRNLLLATTLVVALAGCSTFQQMEDGLTTLVGQDVSVAVSALGFPTGERQIAGMRLIEWGRAESAAFAMPTTSTTTGYVQAGTKLATYGSTTNSSIPMTLNFNCHIALEVDSVNIIRRYQYDGNLGGCAPYIKALKRAFAPVPQQLPIPAPKGQAPVQLRIMQEEI